MVRTEDIRYRYTIYEHSLVYGVVLEVQACQTAQGLQKVHHLIRGDEVSTHLLRRLEECGIEIAAGESVCGREKAWGNQSYTLEFSAALSLVGERVRAPKQEQVNLLDPSTPLPHSQAEALYRDQEASQRMVCCVYTRHDQVLLERQQSWPCKANPPTKT